MSNFDIVEYARGKIKEMNLFLHEEHSQLKRDVKGFVVSLHTDRQNSAVFTTGGTKDLDDEEQKKVVDTRLAKIKDILNGAKK